MHGRRRWAALGLACVLVLTLAGCTREQDAARENTLIYGSADYTRINPALDEHGEINALLFDGLMAHDGAGQVTAGLAERWEYEEETYTYTFYLRDDLRWHDGEAVAAEDVKFTIEAIMNPDNDSENAPDFEDVAAITVVDAKTVSFRLTAPNAAFLDYMTMPILPRHLLEGEELQTSAFFRAPVGTGPYKLERWDAGQAIVLVRNEDYYQGAPHIERIIFKIAEDDSAQAMQLEAGELDMALLDPRSARRFDGREGFYRCDMTTADYRGILFNFHHNYWTENRDILPAVCCAIDRQTIVDAVLLGQGEAAYSPLQRNIYGCADVERYDYDPARACALLESVGCIRNSEGYYERNGQELGFTLSVMAGEQDRLDIAQAAAQQLRQVGIRCTVEIPVQMDWQGQMACLIGWGSPFDADDHTYKVFATGKAANYSGYSNAQVDEYLTLARQTRDDEARRAYYAAFQQALAADPAYAFICYIDANYVVSQRVQGIDTGTVLGHHGAGIFWNVKDWTLTA